MGEKSQNQRTKLIREFSAGGVVFKKNKFLLIKTASKGRWQLPKGHIEKGETSKEAAVREAKEEGGVIVEPIEKLGDTKLFFFWQGRRIFKIVSQHLLEYKADSEEKINDPEVESAEFFTFDEALEKLSFKNDKELLRRAKEVLEG